MSTSNGEVVKTIVHYQECLEKYARRDDESKMLYCIGKLWKLPVTIDHLTDTGVGRTVNSLRKVGGEVGDRAKCLVSKWKEMVAKEEEEEPDTQHNDVDADIENKTEDSQVIEENELEDDEEEDSYIIEETKPQRTSSSNEKKSRNDVTEHNSKKSNPNKIEDSKQNRKQHKDSHKDKDRDSSKQKSKKDIDLADSRDSKHKHKSSKRKHENDTDGDKHSSKSSKKARKTESDSDDHKNKNVKRKHEDDYKEKVSKSKHSEIKNNHEHRTKSETKPNKSHKKKYDSDDEQDDEEDEEEEDDDNSSDESKAEEKEIKKHSSKSHNSSSSREDKHKNNKSKDKDIKDHNHKSKSSSSNKDKDKVKHSSSKDKTKDSTKSKHSSKHSSSSNSSKGHTTKTHSTHSSKNKAPIVLEGGIGSGSGTSFAEALGMLEPSGSSSTKGSKKKIAVVPSLQSDKDSSGTSSPEPTLPQLPLLKNKNLEPLNLNISSLLPEITPNYKPLGHSAFDSGVSRNKIATDDETLSAIMYNKISRTKVYSGNKVAWGKVTSLFDLCTRVLQDNIDALEFTGGVPYVILKPVLERANYNQLFMLEQYNPYLMEDTDELWKLHCQKDFRNRSREEMETWRDMYQRCLEEREIKLRALTANIKQAQDKSIPVRQTKLAYVDSMVKPPRNIARKQAKHGTGGISTSSPKKPATTPSSKLITLATTGAAAEVVVPNPGSRSGGTSGGSNVVVKPKKAPLMQKTLAHMKNLFRR